MRPLPVQCLHNDVGELHKSAVSLRRFSIRNYVLDLSPKSLLFYSFLFLHTAAAQILCNEFSPLPS